MFTERVAFKTLDASPRDELKSLTLFNLAQRLKNVVAAQTIDIEAHVYRERLLKSALVWNATTFCVNRP